MSAKKLKWRKFRITDNQEKPCFEYRSIPEKFLIWDEHYGAGGWELLRYESKPIARFRYYASYTSLNKAKADAERVLNLAEPKEQPRW